MSTLDSKSMIDDIVAHDGLYFEDGEDTRDPRVTHILEYKNQFNGAKTWKLFYSQETFDSVLDSEHQMISPWLYWEWNGIT